MPQASVTQASVAVVGMACRYGGIEHPDAFWQRLQAPAPATEALRRMGPVQAGLAQFGIPPIYRDSINTIQLHLFEMAQQALEQAGLAEGGIDAEFTDVIFCTGFGLNRGYENFARIHAQQLAVEFAAAAVAEGEAETLGGPSAGDPSERLAAQLRQGLQRDFSATSHDKVGEMASSIPARIAAFFKLRGQSMALESLDGAGIQALLAACESLRQGRARAVLLLAAQGVESELMLDVLSSQGIAVRQQGATFAEDGLGGIGEGACALVLKACHAPEPRALAYLDGLYACQPGDEAGLAAQRTALCDRDLVYVDMLRNCCEARYANMLAATAAAVYRSDPLRMCYWGAAQNTTGYTYAASVLTGLVKALLVMRHRQVPPSRTADEPVARRFNDLLNLLLPSQAIPLGEGRIATLVAGEDLRGSAFGVRLSSEFPGAVEAAPAVDRADIAVLGMGACFGQAAGLDEYWDYLVGPADSFSALEGPRFLPQVYRHDDPAEPGSYYIGRASALPLGWLERVQADLAGQGYGAPQLAASTAAQEAAQGLAGRLLGGRVLAVTASNLTLAAEKLAACKYFRLQVEDSLRKTAVMQGLSDAAIRAGLVAVACRLAQQAAHIPALEQLAASGISRLVAEQFGLQAQCVAVEAACAGSLAAIDLAVNSLRAGRCDLALVSGVELPVNINDLCLCSSQRMLAPDLIATFSSEANGFTPGDGAATLVLSRRPLSAGDGPPVRALITALAGCTDSKSMIAPNSEGQIKAMQRALDQVAYDGDHIDFIETHGTGTRIGDQVEIASLARVYRPLPDRSRPLGALKTRFGHCFAAAGMASVIKVVLAMERGWLPANRLRPPINPHLQLAELGFDPLADAQAWPEPVAGPRRAAVNAFGTGGINFHLLLESSPSAATPKEPLDESLFERQRGSLAAARAGGVE
ncbi:polyketide synthase [Chitinimonas arctica]|uniref:Polyketide synthase n=1 Tax=Chitinimonas arctica TaxID=2594795 RepID=A0A516SCT5_9NEIS|nr:polyketide synthase [Chitinimonas arctica]QDQ25965.1 polyketide synthase [Chitinimonas arctica]